MIDRVELDQWLREHDYALVTREQAARLEGMLGLPGVVPWDAHRQALAKADAEIDLQADLIVDLRARVAELEADLDKVEGFRADLAERCFRKDLELDELRDQSRRFGPRSPS